MRAEIDRLNRDFKNIKVDVTMDSSKYIENSIKSVREAAVFGSILAVVVLLLFLRNIRSSMIIAVAIPISVIGTFALMYFYGFTLNTITFGGLALGVGMLVDSAIVVLENIFRHREAGLDKKEAAILGTREVGPAIVASALTTVVVFLPVVFMSGMSGVMFKQLAYVVTFSLLCSLVVALTLVPVLCSKFIHVREPNEKSIVYRFVHLGGVLLERLDGSYQDAIHWALDHRKTVVISTIVLFAGALLQLFAAPGAGSGRQATSATHPAHHAHHGSWPGAHGTRARRRFGAPGADGSCRYRRPAFFHTDYASFYSNRLHDV